MRQISGVVFEEEKFRSWEVRYQILEVKKGGCYWTPSIALGGHV